LQDDSGEAAPGGSCSAEQGIGTSSFYGHSKTKRQIRKPKWLLSQ